MNLRKFFRNGGGASPLIRYSKGFEELCHPEAKPKEQFVILNSFDYFFQNLRFCEKCPVFPQDLKRFFAAAQNDIDISRLGILAQQEIPNRVWNDKKLFPLPQGARNGFSKHAAFTLAEVLITLGIIGIVAAMTIPTLVANYQKKQTLVKLKQTYSILSQALTMAQVEHGDTSTWDVSGIRGEDSLDPNFPKEEKLTNFSQTYLIPYLKVAKDFGYTTGSAIGYDGRYTPITGTYYNNQGYMFLLSNNVYVTVALGGRCTEYDDDGNCIARQFGNIVFLVDVNGFNKPNTMGKDLFYMQFDLVKKKFSMMYSNTNRTTLLNTCETDSGAQFCGMLIFIDNWQIKDDYPWY